MRTLAALFAGTAGTLLVVFWVLAILCGGWLWPYTIGFWSTLASHPIVVPFWIGVVMAFIPVISQLTVPLALLTLLCTFFL